MVRLKRIIILTCGLFGVLHFTNARAEMPLGKQEACTSFRLLVDGRSIVGKNLDWSIEEGILSLNPRGLFKRALVDSTYQALDWVSVYGSISFNQFGREFPLGGMNEAGLVVEELSYWPSRYPPPGDKPSINELQWIQYQLDVHASVAEVMEHISDVQILPLLFGLHYFLADASGNTAVIEFLDKELVVHTGSDLPVAVLTNDTYRNSVRHLSNFVGFGGTRTVGDGDGSPDRFVRAATMLQADEREKLSDPVENAFQILRAVAQDDTQWSIVYDTGSKTVRFTTASVPAERRITLSPLDLDCGGSSLALDLGVFHEGTVGQRLSSWTSEEQDQLITGVMGKIAQEGNIDPLKQQWIQEAMVRLGSIFPECGGQR